ncbi:hypothetical protein FHR81_003846 [Actinoalloteichus hoggarensis]|uniref:Uncharacterized protein n=1 Tax=Actinoalloteichus hoggarensis TaxID=1470176 RepID=A0A221WBQ7_9PSEU|nr:hypothetical protein [Actinoalloteichus hoggarensis]ASO23184.1 hypothetical protein AHOG_27935 [Actinoalloteichus hoggarensis]MBB5922789.1 hypothetical protein [Actinoalloteichus hoggarensis]
MTGSEWEGRGLDPTSGSRPDSDDGAAWSIDLLADLHAGALDDETAARLRPRAESDSDATALFAALDATQAELRDLPPVPPMPAAFADRLDAALAREAAAMFGPTQASPATVTALPASPPAQAPTEAPQGPPAKVVDLDIARRRRRRNAGWAAGLLVAAAAVVSVVAINLPSNTSPGTPMADQTQGEAPPGSAQPPLALGGHDDLNALGTGDIAALLEVEEYGALGDEETLLSCLAAGGIPDANVLGSRTAELSGQPGVMAILGEGFGRFRVVVVSEDCAGGDSGFLGDTTIGG